MPPFVYHMQAVRSLVDDHEGVVTVNLLWRVSRPRVSLEAWARQRPTISPSRVWPEGQQRVLDAVKSRARVEDANQQQYQEGSARYVHVSGVPGCGKTDALL